MKNHTLMQTIARSKPSLPGEDQRTYRGLRWGLPKPGEGAGDLCLTRRGRLVTGPAQRRTRRASQQQCTADAVEYCTKQGVDITGMPKLHGFDAVAAADDAVEKPIATDDTKMAFLAHAAS